VQAILTDEGLGCDAFGAPELRAALRAGVPGARISVNGPCKDAATFAVAIAAGATVTLDDVGELDALRAAVAAAGRPARVHLRLRPDYARITAPSDFSADGASVAQAARRSASAPSGRAPTTAAADESERSRRRSDVSGSSSGSGAGGEEPWNGTRATSRRRTPCMTSCVRARIGAWHAFAYTLQPAPVRPRKRTESRSTSRRRSLVATATP
jgi:hypothetical protein